jgi:hypothetical protein
LTGIREQGPESQPPVADKPTGKPTASTKEDRNGQAGMEKAPVILKWQPNIQKSDFVMKGDPRAPNPGPEKILPRSPPRNKFTTNMRQRYKTEEVYQKVLGTDVTLPLGELLAACPEIEKTLSSETRLCTVPVTHMSPQDKDEDMAEAFANAYVNEFDEDYGWDDGYNRYSHNRLLWQAVQSRANGSTCC